MHALYSMRTASSSQEQPYSSCQPKYRLPQFNNKQTACDTHNSVRKLLGRASSLSCLSIQDASWMCMLQHTAWPLAVTWSDMKSLQPTFRSDYLGRHNASRPAWAWIHIQSGTLKQSTKLLPQLHPLQLLQLQAVSAMPESPQTTIAH